MQLDTLRTMRGSLGMAGFAMPTALLSLLLLSILIAGVLLTSSTEAALSSAYSGATQDFYGAEGAIEQHVSAQNSTIAPGTFSLTLAGTASRFTLVVERLGENLAGSEGNLDSNTRYAIRAMPERGGRTVSAMVRVLQKELVDFEGTNIDAPVVLANGGKIKGTGSGNNTKYFKVSDGRDSGLCTVADRKAENAVVYGDGATMEDPPGNNWEKIIEGGVKESEWSRQDLINHILGGLSMRDIGWNADIKFGSYFNELAWPGVTVSANATDPKYNWGCPREMLDTLRAQSGGQVPRCTTHTDYYPIVAIDGENRTVTLAGDYGQGMLIVVNAPVKLANNFVYKGLILIERSVEFSGGGNLKGYTIEGALIAAGEMILDEGQVGTIGSSGTGNVSIRYNRCAIRSALDSFNQSPGAKWGAPRIKGRPHAWVEVVR